MDGDGYIVADQHKYEDTATLNLVLKERIEKLKQEIKRTNEEVANKEKQQAGRAPHSAGRTRRVQRAGKTAGVDH